MIMTDFRTTERGNEPYGMPEGFQSIETGLGGAALHAPDEVRTADDMMAAPDEPTGKNVPLDEVDSPVAAEVATPPPATDNADGPTDRPPEQPEALGEDDRPPEHTAAELRDRVAGQLQALRAKARDPNEHFASIYHATQRRVLAVVSRGGSVEDIVADLGVEPDLVHRTLQSIATHLDRTASRLAEFAPPSQPTQPPETAPDTPKTAREYIQRALERSGRTYQHIKAATEGDIVPQQLVTFFQGQSHPSVSFVMRLAEAVGISETTANLLTGMYANDRDAYNKDRFERAQATLRAKRAAQQGNES